MEGQVQEGPAMRVMDVVNEAKGAMRASEVFGTPSEKNGVTIIPAAKIAGGDGGGGDEGPRPAGGDRFGGSPRPVGGLGNKGGGVRRQAAPDPYPINLLGQ